MDYVKKLNDLEYMLETGSLALGGPFFELTQC